MGNPLSKNGVITKVVEAVPGGGLLTAPFHAGAGNSKEAVQAAVAGFGSLAGAVVVGPAAGLIASTTTAGLSSIMDNVGVPEDRKQEIRTAASEKDYDHAATVLMEEGQKRIAGNTRQLSAESGGRRSLKSVHGTFLRAYDGEWKVDMAGSDGDWEHWYIEDWHGKVVFKAIHSPGRFLRAHPNGLVDLVDRPQAWEIWTPFKNDDGSWSFLSVHGRWLSAEQNGNVTSVVNCDTWEHFWLGRW